MTPLTWKVTKSELDSNNLLINESLLALGNGYLGVRGNFEEGYWDGYKSIRGTYINAFHDETEITYGEKLHAFPEKQQKLVNVIDAQSIEIFLDGERFSLFEGEISHYERHIHMDKGYSERIIQWRSPGGKEAKLHFRRMVSFARKELFAIDVQVVPADPNTIVKIISTVNGAVTNFSDDSDPRVASGHGKHLSVVEVRKEGAFTIVKDRTDATELEVACTTNSLINTQSTYTQNLTDHSVEEAFEANGEVQFTKLNVYTDTLRHGNKLVEEGIKLQHLLTGASFDDLLAEQEEYLNDFWSISDVQIGGDSKLQEGIRFNLFHLLQSVGKDSVSNIAAKGLSGEGYEGHYFWDTEIYMFPVFLMTSPEIAKNLLLHRYSILDSARERAREMGHEKGALFPWRTITGQESSAFFPAGTAQYHISADIAYSYIQYYLVTKDEEFLKNYMAEVLFETARLWVDTGHFSDGKFRIDNVTGPDEYTCIVNNNYYTNVMAKHNLLWAAKAYRLLRANGSLDELQKKINLQDSEAEEWQQAGDAMYIPYSETLQIHAQDDSFLQKKRWNLESTPQEKFPLLLNYHPLTLYRYQVCKQADTVLAHFLLEEDVDPAIIKNSYDYYEEITTHDSSLSYCVFSIMASKLGYQEKAYDYFIKTARLDLDNTHGNTRDGLHMANMGGTWLAIVFGFAGLRVKESGLSFQPNLPKEWTSLEFKLRYQGRLINIHLESNQVSYTLLEGEALNIMTDGKELALELGNAVLI